MRSDTSLDFSRFEKFGNFLIRREKRLGRTIQVGMRLFRDIVINCFRMMGDSRIRRPSGSHEGSIQQRGVTGNWFGGL